MVFTAYASMLGVLGFDARHALMHATGKSGGNDRLNAMIGRLVGQRNEERARKNFKNADEIRDFLNSIGIELSDGKDGTTWKVI